MAQLLTDKEIKTRLNWLMGLPAEPMLTRPMTEMRALRDLKQLREAAKRVAQKYWGMELGPREIIDLEKAM